MSDIFNTISLSQDLLLFLFYTVFIGTPTYLKSPKAFLTVSYLYFRQGRKFRALKQERFSFQPLTF